MTDLPAEILADSPLAYWNLGATGDASGNARSMAPGTAPSYLQSQLLSGSSLFSTKYTAASSTYLTRAHASWMNVGDTFTVEFVLSLVGTGSGTYQYVLARGGSGGFAVRIADLTGGFARVELVKHGTGVVADAIPDPSGPYGGAWLVAHVVITKSGSTRKIYINGIDRTNLGTNQTMGNPSAALEMGRNPAGSSYLNSYLSDVVLYDYALSASRVLTHFYATRAKVNAAAALPGSMDLSAVGVRQQRPGANLDGALTLGAVAVRRDFAAADPFPGILTLSAVGVRQQRPGAELGGTLTITAETLRMRGVIAAISESLQIQAEMAVTYVGAAALAGMLHLRAGRNLAAIPSEPFQAFPEIVLAAEVSARFQAALRESHNPALLIQILDPSTGAVRRTLDTVQSGSVTLDGSAAIRGRADLEIVDDGLLGLIPFSPRDPLTPYGNEIRICRGIRYPDGTAEVVSLGIFRIRQAVAEDTGDSLAVRIVAQDRWSRIEDARFDAIWTIAAGKNRVQAVTETVQAAWPDAPIDLPADSSSFARAQIAERGENRGDFIREIAKTLGREIYFDGNGTLISTPAAIATDSSRWTLAEGDGGLLLSASREWDAERIYNKVVASGESMDDTPPVSASVIDGNPDSPTYYHGPFGRRPRFYVSGKLETTAQARAAAEGILAKAIGTSQKLELGAMVNPALEPGTVIEVVRERLGINERHVIDEITIPLGAADTMTAKTRLMEIEGE